MKIIDESERLKGEMVGVSLEEEEGIRKRKGVVNNLAEQETSRLLNLSRWTSPSISPSWPYNYCSKIKSCQSGS